MELRTVLPTTLAAGLLALATMTNQDVTQPAETPTAAPAITYHQPDGEPIEADQPVLRAIGGSTFAFALRDTHQKTIIEHLNGEFFVVVTHAKHGTVLERARRNRFA
jgi:hypothetical protein